VISKADQLKILKRYLGRFASVPITKRELKEFDPDNGNVTRHGKDFYMVGLREALYKFGACYLLHLGNIKWDFIECQAMLESMFNPQQEDDWGEFKVKWLNTSVPLLFYYYAMTTPNNKVIFDYLIHAINVRKIEGLQTIVLSEVHLDKVSAYFQPLTDTQNNDRDYV